MLLKIFYFLIEDQKYKNKTHLFFFSLKIDLKVGNKKKNQNLND